MPTYKFLVVLLIILVLIVLAVNLYLILIEKLPSIWKNKKTIVTAINTKFSYQIKSLLINLDKNL